MDRSLVRYLIHAHTVQHLVPPGLRRMDGCASKLGVGPGDLVLHVAPGLRDRAVRARVAEVPARAEPAGSTALILPARRRCPR